MGEIADKLIESFNQGNIHTDEAIKIAIKREREKILKIIDNFFSYTESWWTPEKTIQDLIEEVDKATRDD
jgi:hypothetical protein